MTDVLKAARIPTLPGGDGSRRKRLGEQAPAETTVDVVGSLCENNDKFAIDRRLPRIDRGDLLAVIGALGSDASRPDYDARSDINLDGTINLDDLRHVLLRQGSRLPSAEPHQVGAPLPRIAVDEVFDRIGQAAAQAATARSTTARRAGRTAASSSPAAASNRPLRRFGAVPIDRANTDDPTHPTTRRER